MRWGGLVRSVTLLAAMVLAPAPFAQVRPPVLGPRPGPSRIPEGILSGPRVKSVSVAFQAHAGAVVPFANVHVSVRIEHFRQSAGTRIQYRLPRPVVSSGQTLCTITRNPRIETGDSLVVDQAGEGQLTVAGWFTSPGECGIAIELMVGEKQQVCLVATPITVQRLVRYTLWETWGLHDTLGFRHIVGVGTCEGTSIGPTNRPVGVVERGGDLGLRIRSGPLGTDCQFTGKPWMLPDGVRLVSVTWEKIEEHPADQPANRCCMADAYQTHCLTPIVSVTPRLDRGTARILPSARLETSSPYYAITSADREILTPDNVILIENTTPRVVTVVKPMWCRLECTLTAINDHGIVLVLREVVLDGPPGLTFP